MSCGKTDFDISDRLTDSALAEAVLDGSHDGIFITDGQANAILINKSYETISGLSRADMLGRNLRDLVAEGIISGSGTLKVLSTKQPVTMEQTFVTNKRTIISSTPVFDDSGNIKFVVTNVRDITELHLVKTELRKKERLNRKYSKELETIRHELLGNDDIVAADKTMLSLLSLAKRVSGIDNPVLLTGENGCGKKRLAKYIHANSSRCREPFMICALADIPAGAIEAELFGASGNDKLGAFELAEGGTLFLDDVHLLPAELQARLVRALQEDGAAGGRKWDVRVIAASSKNTEELLSEHLLRENLYSLLSIFTIALPPLRRRRDDIIPLMEHFLADFNRQYVCDKKFDQSARNRLLVYDWPGNVQELRNLVQRAVLISESDVIGADDLFMNSAAAAVKAKLDELPDKMDLGVELERIELGYMTRAYEKYGNTRAAAKSLGMDASTFVRKRQKYIKAGLLQNRND